jgi:hypothetical protein
MTDKERIKKLAKEYDVKVKFKTLKDCRGVYHYNKNGKKITEVISIDPKQSHILSTFFHELGHSYCTNNGKYPYYHYLKGGRWYKGERLYNEAGLRATISTGYRAECYVDSWAEKEMKKQFPNRKYRAGYSQPGAKQWYKIFYLWQFREDLKMLKKTGKKYV